MSYHPLTFLFTDLENSSSLWEKFPGEMRPALATHDRLLKEAVESYRGRIVKKTGDGLHAVFESPADGVAAALAAQQAIITEAWPSQIGPFRVRMGLHTGESQEREGDYYGPEVNRAARVMSIAHGGQTLLSEVTALLVRTTLPPNAAISDLGFHQLRGLSTPEKIFQLNHPDLPTEFPKLKSLAAFKHNLHRQLSSFIGREKEVADVKRLLKETQLLTLLGPGGTGKTRLMLQVAEEVIEEYPDGVWLVELAPLTDPALIPERVAAALNAQEQPGRRLFDTLPEYLRRKELLLLLDNVEHLVQASAEFTEHLLEHCPKLKILVTGREALFIGGETTLQIPSLSLPRENQPLAEIAASEGVQLFLERARSVRPDFELTVKNRLPIAEIVRRLDGIPLALELAAARLRMMSVEQIAARLNDRFRLLTGGRRTALPRQQTLEALIDWSWQLLDEKERILLRRLSVFSGGWSLESAERICGFDPLDDFDVFDHLDLLTKKSLVTVVYPDKEPRYRMLESIRQFGQNKLFEAGEGATLRDRHVDYFVDFAAKAEDHLHKSTMLLWMDRIIQELDNIRLVIAWTLDDRPELALRISGALLSAWSFLFHPSEARTWLLSSMEKARLLFDEKPSVVRVEDLIKAHIGMAFVYTFQSDVKGEIASLEEAIRLANEMGDLRHMAFAIALKTFRLTQTGAEIGPEWDQEVERALRICEQHGFEVELLWLHLVKFDVLITQGKAEMAMPHLQETFKLAEQNKSPQINAIIFAIQARSALTRGDLSAAGEYFLQSIEQSTVINDQKLALMSRSELSHILRRAGNLEEALPLYRETILNWQELGNLAAVAHQLESFAYMGMARGDSEYAARLLGRAQAHRERFNAPSIDPLEVAEMEEAMTQLAEAMGAEERDRVMAEGAKMSMDEAVTLALGRSDK